MFYYVIIYFYLKCSRQMQKNMTKDMFTLY